VDTNSPVGAFAVAKANLETANAAIEIGSANGNRVDDQTAAEADMTETLDD